MNIQQSVSPELNDGTVTDQDRISHYQWMLCARLVDEDLRSLYRQGRIVGGVYLGMGQEAVSAACGMCLQAGDVFAPLIRDAAGRLAFGEEIAEVYRSFLGKRSGYMRGRDGNIHRGSLDHGMLPMISHLGAMVAPVAGMLLARRLRGQEGSVGLVSSGEGGINTGAFHEGLNAAAVKKLPLVAVVANNGYAYSTPNNESFACEDIADRAIGYGVGVHSCDGTDPKATLATLAQAVHAARSGGGTQLVVARLLRLAGHGEHDDAAYVQAADKEAFADCLDIGREQMLALGITEDELNSWRQDMKTELAGICTTVEAEADPDPADERWSAYAGAWPFVDGTQHE